MKEKIKGKVNENKNYKIMKDSIKEPTTWNGK